MKKISFVMKRTKKGKSYKQCFYRSKRQIAFKCPNFKKYLDFKRSIRPCSKTYGSRKGCMKLIKKIERWQDLIDNEPWEKNYVEKMIDARNSYHSIPRYSKYKTDRQACSKKKGSEENCKQMIEHYLDSIILLKNNKQNPEAIEKYQAKIRSMKNTHWGKKLNIDKKEDPTNAEVKMNNL